MNNLIKLLTILLLMFVFANQVTAQIKDGDAVVTQGSTTTVYIGTAYQQTLNRATGISASWSVSSSAISIQSRTNKYCTIKGVSTGTAKLYYNCSYYIDGYYRTMNFYYDITIESNTISVTNIVVSPSSATMNIGETLQLSATVYPTNATDRTLNWTTENYSTASVSSSGLVTARGTGKVWIWANATDGSGAGDYCVVTINEPTKVSAITLSETEKTLTVGEQFELLATISPDDAYNKNVSWSSDNTETATVSNGIVTAINPGECNITCLADDGSGASAVCHVVVQEPGQKWLSVVLPNGNFAINVTETNPVKLNITPDEGYIISSITLDGVEIEHNNGEIELTNLAYTQTLNIVFVTDENSGIEVLSIDNNSVKVGVSGNTINVKGLQSNQIIQVYSTEGVLIKDTKEETFDLPSNGIYILRIGSKVFKLAIK